jgi:hypothetical protein
MDDYVSQETLRLVVIGLVAITAVAVGAGTITSTMDSGPIQGEPISSDGQTGQSQGGSSGGSSGGPGSAGNVTTGEEQPEQSTVNLTGCVRPLTAWYGALAYFGFFALILYGIKRRYSFGATFLGLYALAPPALLGYFLSTDCASFGGPGVGNGTLSSSGGPGSGTQEGVLTTLPPTAILGLFGLVLVATAAVLYRASGDQDITAMQEEETPEGEQADVTDLAEAAGRAADRLEEHNADVDNEVYRAWWEMTSLLEVPNPDSATPGEFADAAVSVGLDRDDVSELTRLFEEVRYGERDAESREESALAVFRNIESEYGETDTMEDNDGA